MRGAYRFLRVNPESEYEWRRCECLDHKDGSTKHFSEGDLKAIPLGSDFTESDNFKSRHVISPEEIPKILKADREREEAEEAERKRIRAEKEATGRFHWSEDGLTEYEILSNDTQGFWEAVLVKMRTPACHHGSPYLKKRYEEMTVDDLKKDERMREFMALVREGDQLEWYEWNAGFLAASGGFVLSRDGGPVAHNTFWVS